MTNIMVLKWFVGWVCECACVRHWHLEANQEHEQQTRNQIAANKGDMGLWVNVQICSEESYWERVVMLSRFVSKSQISKRTVFWAESKSFEIIRFRYAEIVSIWIQLLCGQFYRHRCDQIRAHFHFPKSQLEKTAFLFLANVTVFSAYNSHETCATRARNGRGRTCMKNSLRPIFH